VYYEDNRFYEEITDTCCHIFDIDEFRPLQLPAMTAALEGFDIIFNSTTGSGKSLGYQVRPYIEPTGLPSECNCVGASQYSAPPLQRCHTGFPPRQSLVEQEVAVGQRLNLKWTGYINPLHSKSLF
jgi:hypothetical protein